MVEPSEGAICDCCFLECHARRYHGSRWRFPCDDDLRLYSKTARSLGYAGMEDWDGHKQGNDDGQPHEGRRA